MSDTVQHFRPVPVHFGATAPIPQAEHLRDGRVHVATTATSADWTQSALGRFNKRVEGGARVGHFHRQDEYASHRNRRFWVHANVQ